MLRLFGIPESEIAETLRVAEPAVEGFEKLEITTCLRRAELEVVDSPRAGDEGRLRRPRGRDPRAPRRVPLLDRRLHGRRPGLRAARRHADRGRRVVHRRPDGGAADVPARDPPAACRAASSPTRTRRRTHLLGIDPALIEEHGAVSPEVAEALADGAIDRFDAQVGVGITGIAGPDGGTEEKPVGYVCWCVKLDDGQKLARDIRLPGDRNEIRDRATTVAMHMLRRLLTRRGAPDLTKERLGSPRARLFVALDLPADVRGRLGDLARRADRRPRRPAAGRRAGASRYARVPRLSRRAGGRRDSRGHDLGARRTRRFSRPGRSCRCRRGARASSRSTSTTPTAPACGSSRRYRTRSRRGASTSPRSARSGRTSRSRA